MCSRHSVPGTNSVIEGLTLANSGTNFEKQWDLLLQTVGLALANSGTNKGIDNNIGKEWD